MFYYVWKSRRENVTSILRAYSIWPLLASETVSPGALFGLYYAVCLVFCLLILKPAKVTAVLCICPSSAPECSIPRFIGGAIFMVFKAVD